jgi:hypothetical protein
MSSLELLLAVTTEISYGFCTFSATEPFEPVCV